MATIVQMNKIPIIQWKGQTFDQIHSLIKKNDLKNYTISDDSSIKFRANPLKLYRREIASAKLALVMQEHLQVLISLINPTEPL